MSERVPQQPGSMSHPQVRVRPRTASDQEIAQHNRGKNLSGARRLEPTRKAIQRIRSQKSGNKERLKSWIHHPDERVLIELMETYQAEKPDKKWWVGKLGDWLGEKLLERALRDADQEGIIWSPVLDGLATSKMPPWGSVVGQARKEFPSPAKVLKPLLEEGGKGELPSKKVQRLLMFQTTKIHDRIVRHYQLGAAEAQKLAGHPQAACRVSRMAAEQFTPEGAQRMIQEMMGQLLDRLPHFQKLDRNEQSEAFQEAWRKNRDRTHTITYLGGEGFNPPSAEELLKLVDSLENIQAQFEGDQVASLGRGAEKAALEMMTEQPLLDQLPTKVLESLHKKMLPVIRATRLVGAQQASSDMWTRSLPKTENVTGEWYQRELRKSFLNHPRARKRKDVWAFLAQSTQPSVLARMIHELDDPQRQDQAKKRLLGVIEGAVGKNRSYIRRRGVQHFLDGIAQNSQDLYKLYQACNDMDNLVQRVKDIMQHPEANAQLAAQILEDTRSINLRRYLIGLSWVRQSKQVRETVSNTRDLELLKELIKAADDEEIGRFFKRLARKDAQIAGQKLDELTDQQIGKLQKGDLTPLLKAQDSSIRRKALRMTGKVDTNDENTEQKSPTNTGPRGRSR